MRNKAKIAIIGGGVAGSTTALHLGQLGLDITLFEKEDHISSGPPYCHLHAGGNLYPDISDTQCITLLKQSIDFVRYFPFVVDYRPTVIALPVRYKETPTDLIPRLELLTKEYESLIKKDKANEVLGKSENYYTLYEREALEALKKSPSVQEPKTFDEWMIPVVQNIDLDKVQFPLILVQEYGLNLFRFGSGLELALKNLDSVKLSTRTAIEHITKEKNGWKISSTHNSKKNEMHFDYLINATGFRTGTIDDMVGVSTERMVEFKASYISQWKEKETTLFPEIIFHGERGTPEGMGQFTPYPGGYFQLHGMTDDITLYKDGLSNSTPSSAQPKLESHFLEKLDQKWQEKEINKRTESAIEHLGKFIPAFKQATVASKPLFGAQQIPGTDPTLRVAEVSFPTERYARCEIVKVSSALDMVDAITKDLVTLGYLKEEVLKQRDLNYLKDLKEKEIHHHAQESAQKRAYPTGLARRNVALSK